MKRYTYPVFIKCNPPSAAIKLKDGTYKLPINIKKAFHHAYIDTHGRPPRSGKNPIFDEYEDLLDDSDEFRFLEPGIADDAESRGGESRKLGRGIARYILSEFYGYTWFAKIQNLLSQDDDGWSTERPDEGDNTPDWLISDGHNEFCVGEAKGTHSHIGLYTKKTKKWRKQCTNIILKKNGRKRKLKSWLIATRYVKAADSAKPEQLIEDPFTEGEDLSDNDYYSLNRIIVKNHLVNSLYRLSHYRLAVSIINDTLNDKNRLLVWRANIPELRNVNFIGRPINQSSSFSHHLLRIRNLIELERTQEFWTFQKYLESFNPEGLFDGIILSTVSNYFKGDFNNKYSNEYNLEKYPFLSLLNDGSIIIPLEFMKPYNTIDINSIISL